MRVSRLFEEENDKRVADAIARAESATSGEIVPLVVDQSDAYPHIPFVGGMLGLLIGTLLGIWVTGTYGLSILLAWQAAGFLAGFAALRHSFFLRRALLASRLAEEEVFERALLAFRELELDRTKDRTGILILVSLLERRVQVLADSGINARVKPGTWDGVVETVLRGIRDKDLCGGLCEAIEACGKILAEPFPIQADDRDELPNLLQKG